MSQEDKYFTSLIVMRCIYCDKKFGDLLANVTKDEHASKSQAIASILEHEGLFPVCHECTLTKGLVMVIDTPEEIEKRRQMNKNRKVIRSPAKPSEHPTGTIDSG